METALEIELMDKANEAINAKQVKSGSYEHIQDYYREATADYEEWSKQFNMHFGYYRWGLNPFRREGMLNRMNEEVHSRLNLQDSPNEHVYDLGCGLGASIRYAGNRFQHAKFTGVTIVNWQVQKGRELLPAQEPRLNIIEADYQAVPAPANSADGVYALESACHAKRSDKAYLIAEMHRLLKPGKRLVVADGFMINPNKKAGKLAQRAIDAIGKNWAVDEFAQLEYFTQKLKEQGFVDIEVKDISWNIAPSVLHAPFTVLKFILKKWWKGEKMGEQSINNLKGSLLSLVVGLNRSKFRYCIVSATKK